MRSSLWSVLNLQRRLLSNQSNNEQKAKRSRPPLQRVTRFLSIANSPWMWTKIQPLGAPLRFHMRWSERRPYVTQLSTSLIIYFLGDISGQYIQQLGEHPSAPGQGLVDHYDGQRTLRALCIGAIMSIPIYHWFIYLSTHFNAPSVWPFSRAISLVYKIVIAQVTFTPVFNSYFFGMQSLLSGAGGPESIRSDASMVEILAVRDRMAAAWSRIKDTVPTSWYNSCKFWPFVTAFSFTFIPIRQRSPFAGLCAIGWQSYLGIINQRAVEQNQKTNVM